MAEVKKFIKKRSASISNVYVEGGKLPPQAKDLEEIVLGALMLEKNAISVVVEILKADSFYDEKHKIIYEAIIKLFERADPIDILTVTAELRKMSTLEIVGGAYFITSLTNRVASAANIETHARIIAQKFIQRELIRISGEIQTDAFEESADAFDLLDTAERKLFEVSNGNIKKDYRGINSVMKETIREIEELKNKEGGLTGVPSGFSKLDRATSGFQKSDLIIIAARPGVGKTALMLSIVRNASLSNIEKPKAIAVFSLEMSSKQLISRMISSETEIDGHKLKTGMLHEHEWQQLNSKIAKLSQAPIFIDDTPALSVFELRAKCRRLKQQNNIEMIVVDYLQLMRGDESSNNNTNREQEVAYISRSLKALAKEIDVPVIALAQLSRQSEKRTGFKPMLSDLRESGSIEQDADMVMFIHRPEMFGMTEWEDGSSSHGQAQIIIAKHRNGSTSDDIKLRFINNYTKFTEIADYEYNVDPEMSMDAPGTITISSKLNNKWNESDESNAPF